MPRRRWEDNIRMDLKDIGINTRNWLRIGIIGGPFVIAALGFISHGVSIYD